MEAYLNKGIKEIIDQHPDVENILNEYEIGCGPCTVGICLLKDIVEIHRLPADKEQELMARITKTIDPEAEVKLPEAKETTSPEPKEFNYSPPMKKLVDEHVLIKRWIALIPEVVKGLDVESQAGRQLVLDGVDMIRSYADKFHHAKEEDILFKYFDENSDILKVMHADHKQARGHVQAILEALEKKNKSAIAERLLAYAELLTEHIRKEDEILYPWMDRNLSTRQVGELFSKFNAADEQMGFSPQKYETFIDSLEKKLNA